MGTNAYLALAVNSITCAYRVCAECRPASLWQPSSSGGPRRGRCGKPVHSRVLQSSQPLLTPAQVMQMSET
jgi:hypothetical protein